MPLIVAGREVNRFGGADDLGEIADLLGAPLFMDTEASHTPVVLPNSHSLYAGLFDETPKFPEPFDLYWSVGGTMFALGAAPATPLVPRAASVIHTGLDAAQLGRNYPVDLGLMANTGLTAAAVLEHLRTRNLSTTAVTARRQAVERHHRERQQRLDSAAREMWDARPIASARLATELNQRLDPDAIVVTELVTSAQFLKTYLDIGSGDTRRQNFTSQGGVLGWGVAAAIGAKIAQPDRQVVALVGDGSFQFGVQVLWSAVRYEVPVGVVIWNNGGYQANRRFLHAYGGRAAETGKYVGTSLRGPDIDNVAIASGYGVEGERVDDPGQLGAALDRCLRRLEDGQPYLLDIEIERRWGGADSEWYDFFSVARGEARQS